MIFDTIIHPYHPYADTFKIKYFEIQTNSSRFIFICQYLINKNGKKVKTLRLSSAAIIWKHFLVFIRKILTFPYNLWYYETAGGAQLITRRGFTI